ncbi:hypothetical protein [Winogradskyella costae]|uniref:hypothetical protein n=1 Tax=Winogradskyella costae TaxID=2697008 RepID=UPI0015CABFA0|nr:hypothetical protein [Winogradskyella costae]
MFKQRKNKRFNYKPRFQDSEDKKSRADFEAKWNDAKGGDKSRGKLLSTLPALIILLVLIFVLIYILEEYI